MGEWATAWVVCFALLLGIGLSGRVGKQARARLLWVTLCVCAFVVVRAVLSAWLDDDAAVTFRYAQNVAAGKGLVFNPGERVIGKTSPLWAIVLAPPAAVGLDLPTTAIQLGLLSLVGVLFVTFKLSQTMRSAHSTTHGCLAMLLLACSTRLPSYAVSGLATVPAMLLSLTCLYLAQSRPVRAGCAGIGAMLLEPGCLVFYLAAALDMLTRGQKQKLRRLLLPLLVLGVPVFVAFWFYYGQPVPTHFLARGYDVSHLERGVVALVLTFLAHGLWLGVPVALVGLYSIRHRPLGRMFIYAVPLYLGCIAWIGGNGREGHLTIVILPVASLLVEQGLLVLWEQRKWLGLLLALPAASVVAMPQNLLGPSGSLFGQTDTPRFDRNSDRQLKASNRCESLASSLGTAFVAASPKTTVATDCAGPVAYRTWLSVLDLSGDLDKHIARHRFELDSRPVTKREGHAAYLLARAVDLSEVPVWPDRYAHLTQVLVAGSHLHWGIQREVVAAAVRAAPRSHVASVSDYIASRSLDPGTPDGACDLWFLDLFYFSHGRASERAQLVSRLSETGNVRAFHTVSDDQTPPGWLVVDELRLERHERLDWIQTGPGFAFWPRLGTASEQFDVSVNDKWLINSFRISDRRDSVGRLQSPTFQILGDTITMRIGGAYDPERLFVGLLLDGQVVMRAAACGSNIMRRHVWDVAGLRGRTARLLFVDELGEDRNDLIVTDVQQWRRVPTSRQEGP